MTVEEHDNVAVGYHTTRVQKKNPKPKLFSTVMVFTKTLKICKIWDRTTVAVAEDSWKRESGYSDQWLELQP